MKRFFPIILVLLGLQSWSCGLLQTVAVKSTTGILDEGMAAIYEESDLQLAEQAIASDLKLLEALHKSDPSNDHLLIMLTQAYAGYALGFVEDQDPERAKLFYARARDYGLEVLRENKTFSDDFDEGPATFVKGVESLSDDDVPALFWTANAWGNLINLSISDPDVVADLYKVNAMMDFVLRHDEKFFYGGAHLYFGAILATTPKALGGDPEKAKEHFERCLTIGDHKLLLPYVYYAKTYAVQVQNKKLFESLLTTVDTTSIDVLPEQRLINAIAKRKAKALLAKTSEYF
ncbi:MAG TPA: TRAP transporter TatT component family protein [Bacteroidota bacterium]|nr:TRAP transporter TatT component family protein [Bacteroidota bacterium]